MCQLVSDPWVRILPMARHHREAFTWRCCFHLFSIFALVDKWAKLVAFQATDAGSIPAESTIWLCGRTGRVTALSRRSLWDRAPPESPLSGVLVQKSRTPACHAGGHGFKSRIRCHPSRVLLRIEVMGNT